MGQWPSELSISPPSWGTHISSRLHDLWRRSASEPIKRNALRAEVYCMSLDDCPKRSEVTNVMRNLASQIQVFLGQSDYPKQLRVGQPGGGGHPQLIRDTRHVPPCTDITSKQLNYENDMGWYRLCDRVVTFGSALGATLAPKKPPVPSKCQPTCAYGYPNQTNWGEM